MRTTQRIAGSIALLALIVASGCDFIGFEAPVKVTVKLDRDNPDAVAQTARILERRFDEQQRHFNSKVTSEARADRIVFTFTNGAPGHDVVESLARTTGKFRVYPYGRRVDVWLTERDVVEAQARYDNDRYLLSLHLSGEAGQRMITRTSQYVGQVLVAEFDGVEVTRATVQGVFGAQFEITGMPKEQVFRMRDTLRFGALPANVLAVEFES
jgi:hypothetical protein